MEFFLPLAALAFVSLWAFLRFILLLSERTNMTSLPPDFPLIVVWMNRIILLTIALVSLGWTAFLLLLALLWGRSTSFDASSIAIMGAGGSVILYGLVALVLNFPFFPLQRHARLFLPVQLLLLPVVGVGLVSNLFYGAIILLIALGYGLLWALCLRDRITYQRPPGTFT